MHHVVERTEVHAHEAGSSEAEQPDHNKESASECCSFCNHHICNHNFSFFFCSQRMDIVHSSFFWIFLLQALEEALEQAAVFFLFSLRCAKARPMLCLLSGNGLGLRQPRFLGSKMASGKPPVSGRKPPSSNFACAALRREREVLEQSG